MSLETVGVAGAEIGDDLWGRQMNTGAGSKSALLFQALKKAIGESPALCKVKIRDRKVAVCLRSDNALIARAGRGKVVAL